MSGLFSPPEPGRIASAGRCTSLNTSSLVSDARNDSFPFWSLALNPFESVGTMYPRIDFPSGSLSAVFAHTMQTCAVDPFLIHILAPFRIHEPSACSRARVIMPAGFEPDY